ncbi:MAG: adenylate/guanylate cyclase domain-containing protein [Hyphomicrobiales bacterium]|nr:MAG: adenylate/guanylate cyclase domain-containing protein [Hyphomicrobiales bacterium]
MLSAPIDTAPRRYPPGLHVHRRSSRGPDTAPPTTTLVEIAAWLLSEALAEDDLMLLFESLAWRLKAAGLPFERSSLSVGTLHPQLVGFSWYWNARDGFCDEIKITSEARDRDAYRQSPLYQVIELGEQVRCDPQDPATRKSFPLMQDLLEEGFTDYYAMPLRGGGSYHNVVTIATRRDGGFPEPELLELKQILSLFALHVERHILNRIAGNVMDTYLGHAAGKKVLNGAITRGDGEAVRAVIWVSDLRGFTDLSDRLAGEDVMKILNAYFERQAGAVMAHGGEVLKFIGDGMLAVFPYDCAETGASAAQAAVDASHQVLREMRQLNSEPPPELARIEGWGELSCGIGLHAGDVFFGNVGAPERLDFTVIGRAVNITARIEDLTKTIGQPVLISDQVAGHLSCPLEHHGHHRLRGLSEEMALFSPQAC